MMRETAFTYIADLINACGCELYRVHGTDDTGHPSVGYKIRYCVKHEGRWLKAVRSQKLMHHPYSPYEKAVSEEMVRLWWEDTQPGKMRYESMQELYKEAVTSLYVQGIYSDPYHEAINSVPY